MNIVGEEVEEVEDSATVKHKEYDAQLNALKQAEANVEAALASHFSADKLGSKNKKRKTDIKAAFLLKFSADIKKNLRATKQRL